MAVWKSTSGSGAPDNSSLSHFAAMARPSWLGRAVRNRHRHAIEQASRRWRGGRRDDSARTRRKVLISQVDGELHANAQPAGSSDEGKRLAKRKKTSDLVFQRNSDLSGAVEPWSPGTLAVVAACVEIKILRRVHAIDATPARWRGDAGSSPCTRLTGWFPHRWPGRTTSSTRWSRT